MRPYLSLLLSLLRRVLRSRDDLPMEHLMLRQQLAVYTRRPKRPRRTLALDSPDGREPQAKPSATAAVVSRPVLGGLHHEYDWAA